MLQFLRENWGNILVLAVIAAAVAGALLNMRRKKKSGCGCGCDSCPSKGFCHPEK
ncbi:MAG: FeoB-associated Cys-rich membrane protein [Oscillospiraceae bacterium]|nr:FeoB-associated Cys-rich membrane protein [Oscillospiraceae bacterium]